MLPRKNNPVFDAGRRAGDRATLAATRQSAGGCAYSTRSNASPRAIGSSVRRPPPTKIVTFREWLRAEVASDMRELKKVLLISREAKHRSKQPGAQGAGPTRRDIAGRCDPVTIGFCDPHRTACASLPAGDKELQMIGFSSQGALVDIDQSTRFLSE